MKYPFDGEFFPAKEKKFQELIFFVPFYEGTKAQIKKHIDFVNDLGYDAFAFHLSAANMPQLKMPSLAGLLSPLDLLRKLKEDALKTEFISSSGEFGARHVYADQIELLLNQFSQKKIVFSFSNPSTAAIKALSLRQCSDVAALICDSGPAAKNFVRSVNNLNETQKYPGNKIKSLVATTFMSLLWGLNIEEDLLKYLENFPADFPILSIRGWKDPLISPSDIDAAFDKHPHLHWTKLSLPEAAHLNGLRDFPQEYKPQVTNFLKKFSVPVLN